MLIRGKNVIVSVVGAVEARRSLQEARRLYPKAFARAVYERGVNFIFNPSQMIVPVKTGRLRASGFVYPPSSIRKPITRIGYGTNYGYWVHERTELRHVVGQSKFLSTPYFQQLPTMVGWIDRRTRSLAAANDVKMPTTTEKGTAGAAKSTTNTRERDNRGRYKKKS